jgi:hypothetical protein
MALSMFLFAALELLGARTIREGSVLQVVWLRYFFHLVLMLALLAPRVGLEFVRTSRPILQLARSLTMLVMPACFALGTGGATAVHVFGVFWMNPLLVLLLTSGAGDRPSGRTWLAAVAGWCGAMAVYQPPVASMGASVVYGIGMAACFGAYIVMTRALDRTERLLTNQFYSAVGVFVVLTVSGFGWKPVSPMTLVGGVLVAAVGWLSLAALDVALRHARPSELAAFLFSQIVIYELAKAVLQRRPPGPTVAIGLIVIVGAMTAVALEARTTEGSGSRTTCDTNNE